MSRQTFRSERYPEYKANRSSTPDEFRGQIDITKEVLFALGITVLAEPGFEADDIIATLATQAENEGYRVLVVTGDRDSLQLVSDDVTVLYPVKGVSELTRFTPDAVQAKYGLTPTQYPDFAALRGDPSDNLPGIPGVGEKTATKWIAEYGSLQALVDNVDAVKGKVGDALRAHLSGVILNRELTDLVKDVPLAQTPDTLRMQPWDRDLIHRLFDDLEFRVLRDRLFDTLASTDPEVDEGFDVRGGALAPGTVGAWLAEHAADGRRAGLAVVGTHLAFDADATALAIAAADGDGCYIDTAGVDPARTRRRSGTGWPTPTNPRHCTRQNWPCTTWPAVAGPWPESPPTRRWRPTWCGPGSAASPSMTCRCVTFVANCARILLSSNNFRYSMTTKASTTRRCRP